MTLRSIIYAAVICFAAFAIVVVGGIYLIGWPEEVVLISAAISALTAFVIMILRKT